MSTGKLNIYYMTDVIINQTSNQFKNKQITKKQLKLLIFYLVKNMCTFYHIKKFFFEKLHVIFIYHFDRLFCWFYNMKVDGKNSINKKKRECVLWRKKNNVSLCSKEEKNDHFEKNINKKEMALILIITSVNGIDFYVVDGRGFFHSLCKMK